MMLTIFSAALLAAAPAQTCREIVHHKDGTTSMRDVPDEGQGASSSSRSAGGSAHSSVAASSSSSDGVSRSSASANGGSIEVERDGEGCRITITERGE